MSEHGAPVLSVVVPLFDEVTNVEPLCRRLLPVLRNLGVSFELLLVDDGSRDGTLAELLRIRGEQRELIVLSLARNFGQHAALTAGFAQARGELVVTLDADLQNPPEEIPRLLAEFRNGHDMIATVRERRQDSWFRRRASALVNRVTRRISGIQLTDFGCMLRGYSREIVRAIVAQQESGTFLPALGYLYARNPVEIPVAHEPRHDGRSKYSLVRLFKLHLDLVTGFSLAPLRFLFGAGFVIATAGVLFALLLIVLRIVHGPGWAAEGVFTLFAILFFFIGAQFVAFGLLGEYVGRVFQSVRRRPVYVLRELPERVELRPAETDFVVPSASRRVNA